MIEVDAVTKRYGEKTAVDSLSFRAEPGSVTGFLGPNGAGKSTTMRMVVGLDRPSSGSVRVSGREYVRSRAPLTELGALLDAKASHPARTARMHLRALGATHGISARRVDEVLATVGLTSVADRRAGTFSLGMGQRLGIAAALIGDPAVVMLDEPVNGLDPEGVRWVRTLLRGLASEGRTVLVSSHLMSEMAQTADHLVVIGRGRVVADTTVDELTQRAGDRAVRVASDDQKALGHRLAERGATVQHGDGGSMTVTGVEAPEIGDAALSAGVVLHELTPVHGTLEDAFMELTSDDVEYATAVAA